MSYAWRMIAGVTAALTVAAYQSGARADDSAAAPVTSVQAGGVDDEAPELAEARCDWRCLIAPGAVVGETADLLEQFGSIIELMPRPNGFQCLTADKDDWLLKLRCTYWTLKDQAEKDDDDDADDEEDTPRTGGNTDPWGTGGKSDTGSQNGGSRPNDDVSSAGLGG